MFPKIHIFLFTEKNKSMYPPLLIPLSTIQPIYDHRFVISHFANYITHDIMCKYTYNKITNQLLWGIFRIIARKLANLQLFCILTSFLLEFRKITLKSIFSLFNICGIKFAECLPNIFSYPSELRYNVFLTSYNI